VTTRIINRIEKEASKLTIEFNGKHYNSEELLKLYNTAFDSNLSNLIKPISEIPNDKDLNSEELNEIKTFIKKQGAKTWKAKIRKKRRDGKLEQYQIDALNKLGMIWHAKSVGSHDEWENNYLIFKNFGFCIEIKEWINNQRVSFKEKTISNENLFRLEAINFPFEPLEDEEYKLTNRFIWGLREQLDSKKKDYITKEKLKYGIDKIKTLKENEGDSEEEFYRRAYESFDLDSLMVNMKESDSLNHLKEIIKGEPFYNKLRNKHYQNFLVNEKKAYEKLTKKVPDYIIRYCQPVKLEKLNKKEIYFELSLFDRPNINPLIRKQACLYMLNSISHTNIRESKFREVAYLISTFKKEKNLTELDKLLQLVNEYPILKEMYKEKLEKIIFKLSSEKKQ